jgi:phage-related protein
MTKTNQVAAFILGAAAGVALIRFLSMPKIERQAFYDDMKKVTSQLLDNAEDTVEKVEHYMNEFKDKGEGQWIDKLFVLKKMFRNFYGSEKHYLL